MTQLVLKSETLRTLDEPAVFALLRFANSDELLNVWAPQVTHFLNFSGAFVERFYDQCSALGLLQELADRGYLSCEGAWCQCVNGQWLTAKMLRALGQKEDAWALYCQLLKNEFILPTRLAIEASRFASEMGELSVALKSLEKAMHLTLDYDEWQRTARLYQRLEQRNLLPHLPVVRVALMLTSAPQLIAPILRAMGFVYGIRIELFIPDFNTIEQTIFDESSELHAFNPQVVILGVNFHDLSTDVKAERSEAWVTEAQARIHRIWQGLNSKFNCRILQHLYDLPVYNPAGNLAAVELAGSVRCIRALNASLISDLPSYVSIVDVVAIQAKAGSAWSDDRMWFMARQHPAPAVIPNLVADYTAIIRAHLGRVKKVLVLDLDNTLWGGIIGEDGLAGIQIGTESPEAEAYRAFQRYVLHLKRRGVLLAVCSKNDHDSAVAPFRDHDGMLLKLDDFVAFKANWESKHLNLQAIAAELSLGLDSFVFVDDNPAECHLVYRQLPEVTVVQLPSDPADYIAALDRGRWFEALSVSDEDRMRSATYQQEVQRNVARATTPSLEGYLSSLNMVACSGAFDLSRLTRIAQLTQRTNQFNLTTRRYTQEELQLVLEDSSCWARWFSLRDRFGDHGISGLVILRQVDSQWEVDSFLMSCRVIGRGFEDYMLNELISFAKKSGIERIVGLYQQTKKNEQVADFYLQHKFGFLQEIGGLHQFSCLTSRYESRECFIRSEK